MLIMPHLIILMMVVCIFNMFSYLLFLETIDEKRLRLAKKLVQEAKTAHNIEDDDFFIGEKKPFQGVYREDDEEDLVTKALQKDVVIILKILKKI